MKTTLMAIVASIAISGDLCGAPPAVETPLAAAAERVAKGLADRTVTLHSYKRSLAWEGLLRWGQASGRDRHVEWVFTEAANTGLTPGSEANFRRGPFNCLAFWLHEVSDDERWLPGFIEQTKAYREEVARSPEGAILHPRGRQRGGGQAMLIDALQDYSSRMAMLGRVTGDQTCFDEAVQQHRIYRNVVRDPQTGLWSQGRGWRNDPNELSPGAWSRGHGWLIRGMVDTLLLMPRQSPQAAELRRILRELADALLKVQQPSGMWHCLLHRAPIESPPETSGTALIAANLAIAVAEGFLEHEKYAEASRRAFAALPRYVDQRGVVHSVSPGPGPLSDEQPWAVKEFPEGDEHGPLAILFAALGEEKLSK
jgi:rhamnogalacturonyl hydrolase YesR